MNKKIMKGKLSKAVNLFKKKLFIRLKMKTQNKRTTDNTRKFYKNRSKLILNLSSINNIKSRKIKHRMLDKTRSQTLSQTHLKKMLYKIKI